MDFKSNPFNWIWIRFEWTFKNSNSCPVEVWKTEWQAIKSSLTYQISNFYSGLSVEKEGK